MQIKQIKPIRINFNLEYQTTFFNTDFENKDARLAQYPSPDSSENPFLFLTKKKRL